MKTIAIIAKPHAQSAKKITQDICKFLKDKKIEVLLDERASKVMGIEEFTSDEEIAKRADMIIVLGGDGTLISAIRILGQKATPILGINLGRLGFLTETKVDDALETLKGIILGNFKTERRMKLHSHIVGEVDTIFEIDVLNDVVINKGALARIIEIDVCIDGQYVNTYRADGLIISTPIGSTAYTLAAGGPIVYPGLNSIIITPICPHALTHRPIVISEDSEVHIKVKNDDEKVFVTFDGQICKRLEVNQKIIIRKATTYANLIVSPKQEYFSVLREKLGWGCR
jgi:NAD+ kinase